MRIHHWLLLLTVLALAPTAHGAGPAPQPVAVDALRWIRPPPVPGLAFAWVRGAEQQSGLYILRVRLSQGAAIPPHTHPDTRHTTVLAGTLYVGFGERLEATSLVAVAAGDVYEVPAGVAHFLLARDGDVEYQEAGIGPTATAILPAP